MQTGERGARPLTYQRVEHYWGDLPVNQGRNFDEIRYDYYRDISVMFENFRGRQYRLPHGVFLQALGSQLRHSRGKESIVLKTMPDKLPGGFEMVLNTRRAKFADVRVH